MPADEVLAAWDDTVRLLAERGIVSVFLRFAPYRDGVERRVTLPGLELVELSETVLLELGEEASMWEGMHGRSRTAIRKAEREGLHAQVVMERPLSLGSDSGFRNVYEVAMERVGATAAHLHSDDYYERLSRAEDVDLHLVEVRDADDEVVAATLLLIDEEAVHYHLSGSVVEAARNGANNLMIWTAMKWAAAEGHKRFHLGGGTSRADGLFRFKASFGGVSMPFFVGRLIVRPEAYASLVTEHARRLGVRPSQLQESSFFPAYRAVRV
ncbi:GNAT family N-acetyltransferase [Microbacterium sp. 22242]|uniref:GNAT family N-acetyltransferase n=1 Tax=Microbacterium sp. 22242 TaxID=3453896 RepID=UPI003F873643